MKLLIYLLIGLLIDFIFILIMKLLISKFNIDIWKWFDKTFETREGTLSTLIVFIPIFYLPLLFILFLLMFAHLLSNFIEFCCSTKVVSFFKKIIK